LPEPESSGGMEENMRFTTLETIARLLEANVEEKKTLLNSARARVADFEDAEDEGKEIDKAGFEYWKNIYRDRLSEMNDAKRALNDFMEQEWR
jgi:hypothetical protein